MQKTLQNAEADKIECTFPSPHLPSMFMPNFFSLTLQRTIQCKAHRPTWQSPNYQGVIGELLRDINNTATEEGSPPSQQRQQQQHHSVQLHEVEDENRIVSLELVECCRRIELGDVGVGDNTSNTSIKSTQGKQKEGSPSVLHGGEAFTAIGLQHFFEGSNSRGREWTPESIQFIPKGNPGELNPERSQILNTPLQSFLSYSLSSLQQASCWEQWKDRRNAVVGALAKVAQKLFPRLLSAGADEKQVIFAADKNKKKNKKKPHRPAAASKNAPESEKKKSKERTKTTVLRISENTWLDVTHGLMLHIWRSPSNARNFVKLWDRVWQTLFEHRIMGISCPLSVLFDIFVMPVSITVLPPIVFPAGLPYLPSIGSACATDGEGEAGKLGPLRDGMGGKVLDDSEQSRKEILSDRINRTTTIGYMARRLLTALYTVEPEEVDWRLNQEDLDATMSSATSITATDSTVKLDPSVTLFFALDGRFYLLMYNEIAEAQPLMLHEFQSFSVPEGGNTTKETRKSTTENVVWSQRLLPRTQLLRSFYLTKTVTQSQAPSPSPSPSSTLNAALHTSSLDQFALLSVMKKVVSFLIERYTTHTTCSCSTSIGDNSPVSEGEESGKEKARIHLSKTDTWRKIPFGKPLEAKEKLNFELNKDSYVYVEENESCRRLPYNSDIVVALHKFGLNASLLYLLYLALPVFTVLSSSTPTPEEKKKIVDTVAYLRLLTMSEMVARTMKHMAFIDASLGSGVQLVRRGRTSNNTSPGGSSSPQGNLSQGIVSLEVINRLARLLVERNDAFLYEHLLPMLRSKYSASPMEILLRNNGQLPPKQEESTLSFSWKSFSIGVTMQIFGRKSGCHFDCQRGQFHCFVRVSPSRIACLQCPDVYQQMLFHNENITAARVGSLWSESNLFPFPTELHQTFLLRAVAATVVTRTNLPQISNRLIEFVTTETKRGFFSHRYLAQFREMVSERLLPLRQVPDTLQAAINAEERRIVIMRKNFHHQNDDDHPPTATTGARKIQQSQQVSALPGTIDESSALNNSDTASASQHATVLVPTAEGFLEEVAKVTVFLEMGYLAKVRLIRLLLFNFHGMHPTFEVYVSRLSSVLSLPNRDVRYDLDALLALRQMESLIPTLAATADTTLLLTDFVLPMVEDFQKKKTKGRPNEVIAAYLLRVTARIIGNSSAEESPKAVVAARRSLQAHLKAHGPHDHRSLLARYILMLLSLSSSHSQLKSVLESKKNLHTVCKKVLSLRTAEKQKQLAATSSVFAVQKKALVDIKRIQDKESYELLRPLIELLGKQHTEIRLIQRCGRGYLLRKGGRRKLEHITRQAYVQLLSSTSRSTKDRRKTAAEALGPLQRQGSRRDSDTVSKAQSMLSSPSSDDDGKSQSSKKLSLISPKKSVTAAAPPQEKKNTSDAPQQPQSPSKRKSAQNMNTRSPPPPPPANTADSLSHSKTQRMTSPQEEPTYMNHYEKPHLSYRKQESWRKPSSTEQAPAASRTTVSPKPQTQNTGGSTKESEKLKPKNSVSNEGNATKKKTPSFTEQTAHSSSPQQSAGEKKEDVAKKDDDEKSNDDVPTVCAPSGDEGKEKDDGKDDGGVVDAPHKEEDATGTTTREIHTDPKNEDALLLRKSTPGNERDNINNNQNRDNETMTATKPKEEEEEKEEDLPAVDASYLLTREHLLEDDDVVDLFKLCDLDCDGWISADDFVEVFGALNVLPHTTLRNVFVEHSANIIDRKKRRVEELKQAHKERERQRALDGIISSSTARINREEEQQLPVAPSEFSPKEEEQKEPTAHAVESQFEVPPEEKDFLLLDPSRRLNILDFDVLLHRSNLVIHL